MSVPPGPWPGQNTAIYRTGATWASKWPLGPARVLLECPAGPFGPVSALPGRSKCRSALEPLGPRNGCSPLLRCCRSVRQGRLTRSGLIRCCQGAQNGRSKPPVQPLGPRNGRLGPPRFWWSAQQGRLGLFRRCQGAQNGCSEPPVCLKRRFRLLKHCYR